MTLNPPPGHRERARHGKGCVYACCFAGAQGMGRSHGRVRWGGVYAHPEPTSSLLQVRGLPSLTDGMPYPNEELRV